MINEPKKPEPSKDENGNPKIVKKPEFIILEDSRDYVQDRQNSRQKANVEESFEPPEMRFPIVHPITLRLLCLLGMFISVLVVIGMFIWVVVFFALATLLFFQVQAVNQILYQTWRVYTNASAAMIGFALAVISPALGIGFLVIYFSLKRVSADQNLLKQILKNLFNRM